MLLFKPYFTQNMFFHQIGENGEKQTLREMFDFGGGKMLTLKSLTLMIVIREVVPQHTHLYIITVGLGLHVYAKLSNKHFTFTYLYSSGVISCMKLRFAKL